MVTGTHRWKSWTTKTTVTRRCKSRCTGWRPVTTNTGEQAEVTFTKTRKTLKVIYSMLSHKSTSSQARTSMSSRGAKKVCSAAFRRSRQDGAPWQQACPGYILLRRRSNLISWPIGAVISKSSIPGHCSPTEEADVKPHRIPHRLPQGDCKYSKIATRWLQTFTNCLKMILTYYWLC